MTGGRTRTSAYSLQPGARPIEVDSGDAEPGDATTTDANSVCVVYAILACTDGTINSLLIAQIPCCQLWMSATVAEVFHRRSQSLPIGVHQKGSIE